VAERCSSCSLLGNATKDVPLPRTALTPERAWLTGQKSKAQPKPLSQYAGGRPKAPRHLSDAARVEFTRVSKLLGARNTETPADASALALYAEVYARWVDLKAQLDGQYMVEVTVLDNNGQAHVSKRVNPLLKELNAVEGRLVGLIRELGITPRTRESVKTTAPAKQPLQIVPGSALDLCPEAYPELHEQYGISLEKNNESTSSQSAATHDRDGESNRPCDGGPDPDSAL
jgi:P27 family predicted phage terminase small subunit